MLYKEVNAVCCENRTEHTNTQCGQNTSLLKQVAPTFATLLYRARGLHVIRVCYMYFVMVCEISYNIEVFCLSLCAYDVCRTNQRIVTNLGIRISHHILSSNCNVSPYLSSVTPTYDTGRVWPMAILAVYPSVVTCYMSPP
jgi:hypothetical protein